MDKSSTRETALQNAIQAAELYMAAAKHASNDRERARLRGKCQQLTSRAENIKQSTSWTPVHSQEISLKAPVSQRALSKREEIILLEGSKLHGFIFPQWTSDPDNSVFAGDENGQSVYTCVLFSVYARLLIEKNRDSADLKLSDAQGEIFAGWRRPQNNGSGLPECSDYRQTCDEASMIAVADIDLVQDITTDCSVVASLCAGTARARQGHGKVSSHPSQVIGQSINSLSKLLASIIYPYDQEKARPQVSKTGKYIFRLHFNGCFRKVVIDDRLPASNTSRSLHVIDRNNPKLIWPALMEKAYLKVRGGYDFPGSNSGTDLWVLTGWIPEQIFLQRSVLLSSHPHFKLVLRHLL